MKNKLEQLKSKNDSIKLNLEKIKEMTIICDQDNPFENLKKHKCVKNCDFNEMLQKICILRYVTNETKRAKNNEIK